MGLMGLLMACYGGLYGILIGLTKSILQEGLKNAEVDRERPERPWQSSTYLLSAYWTSQVLKRLAFT